MKFGDEHKNAKLNRDGVLLKVENKEPEFFPWGEGHKALQVALNAEDTATNALSVAENAQATADGAQSAAETAQATADGAQAAAEAAQATADGAQSAAEAAQETADGAQSAAEAAQATADGAQSAAESAQATADGAQSAAENAQTTADSALALAESSVQKTVEESPDTYKQTAGLTLESQEVDGHTEWHMGRNKNNASVYQMVETINDNVICRSQIVTTKNDDKTKMLTYFHGTYYLDDKVRTKVTFEANENYSYVQLQHSDRTTVRLRSEGLIVLQRGNETRTIDLWELAGA